MAHSLREPPTLAMPQDGQLICCDLSAEWTDNARHCSRKAGIDGRIDPRIGPALETLETLDALLAQDQAGRFELVFIDAEKQNYLA